MFSWLKDFFRKPEPLPPLGFSPNFLDPDIATCGSVVVSIENDDVTGMEFVVQVLRDYFCIDCKGAVKLMLKVHDDGSAEIRIMSVTDANRVIAKIKQEADDHGFPLQCTTRPFSSSRSR